MSRLSSGSAAPAGGVAHALPFLQCDASGRFVLQPAAIKLISSIKGRICPVVVAGPYRTGKSTLLNLLLDRNVKGASGGGFAVGGTVQACTKGMHLWGEPIVIGDCTYLFIDSEGLGSTDQHATFDTQIFSLSILLSSLFILNTQGTINENALEQLELVVQMTDRIRAKEEAKKGAAAASSEEATLHALSQFFPSFLWILRDFTLQLQNARGETITADEYLEDALRPVPVGPNSKKSVAEKNRIRQAIATVFQNRHCVTMVRPVAEERDLQRVSTIGSASLRNDFRTQIEHLKALIPQLAHPKAVEGVELNGRSFVAIAQNYVDAINSGGIPTIRTAFQSVQEITSREAMDAALDLAQRALKDRIDSKGDAYILADDALNVLLGEIETAALRIIQEQALGTPADLAQLQQHFVQKHLAGLFTAVRDRNAHRAEKSFQATVEGLWDESGIEAHLSQYDSYKQLNSDVMGFWAKYLSLTKNQGSKVMQIEVGRTFLDKKRELIFKSLFERLGAASQALAAATKANEAHQKTIADLTQQLQQVQQERAIEERKLQLELSASQKEASRLHKSVEEAERQARAATERAHTERAHLERQLADASHSANSQLATLQAQLSAAQSTIARLEAEAANVSRDSAKEVAALNKQIAKLEKSVAQAESAFAAANTDASKQVVELQQQVRAAQKEASQNQVALNSLQSTHASLQTNFKQLESDRATEARAHKESVDAKEKQLKSLQKSVAELESGLHGAKGLQKVIDGQERDIQKLTNEKEALEKELAATKMKHQKELQAAQAAAASAAAAVAAAPVAASGYANPLGLPEPTKGPLVSRTSVIPSSFSSGASAKPGKRKSSPVAEDEHAAAAAPADEPDYDMVDAGGDIGSEDEEDAAAARREAAAAAAGSNATAQPLRDPTSLPINALKSWLTSLDVEFPMKQQPKAFYVDLIYQTLGDKLEKLYPRGGAKKKAAKK